MWRALPNCMGSTIHPKQRRMEDSVQGLEIWLTRVSVPMPWGDRWSRTDWLLLESEDPGPPITESMAERGSDREAEEGWGQQPVREAALGPHGSDSQATQPCSTPQPSSHFLNSGQNLSFIPINYSLLSSVHPSLLPQSVRPCIHPSLRFSTVGNVTASMPAPRSSRPAGPLTEQVTPAW